MADTRQNVIQQPSAERIRRVQYVIYALNEFSKAASAADKDKGKAKEAIEKAKDEGFATLCSRLGYVATRRSDFTKGKLATLQKDMGTVRTNEGEVSLLHDVLTYPGRYFQQPKAGMLTSTPLQLVAETARAGAKAVEELGNFDRHLWSLGWSRVIERVSTRERTPIATDAKAAEDAFKKFTEEIGSPKAEAASEENARKAMRAVASKRQVDLDKVFDEFAKLEGSSAYFKFVEHKQANVLVEIFKAYLVGLANRSAPVQTMVRDKYMSAATPATPTATVTSAPTSAPDATSAATPAAAASTATPAAATTPAPSAPATPATADAHPLLAE